MDNPRRNLRPFKLKQLETPVRMGRYMGRIIAYQYNEYTGGTEYVVKVVKSNPKAIAHHAPPIIYFKVVRAF